MPALIDDVAAKARATGDQALAIAPVLRHLAAMRPISALLLALPLAACHAGGWRDAAAADAQKQIIAQIAAPSARFSQVQVVGDSQTGQTCGMVLAPGVSIGWGTPVRFIVYIDHTAGPWIEGQHSHEIVSDDRFDFAWQHDCIDEGWQPSAQPTGG